MSAPPPAQHVLYYSRRCPHCDRLIKRLQAMGLAEEFGYVDLDVPDNLRGRPPQVDRVPTVLTADNHCLMEGAIHRWLDTMAPDDGMEEVGLMEAPGAITARFTPVGGESGRMQAMYADDDGYGGDRDRGGAQGFTLIGSDEGPPRAPPPGAPVDARAVGAVPRDGFRGGGGGGYADREAPRQRAFHKIPEEYFDQVLQARRGEMGMGRQPPPGVQGPPPPIDVGRGSYIDPRMMMGMNGGGGFHGGGFNAGGFMPQYPPGPMMMGGGYR